MDIPNLATLFGPILLRPAGEQSPNDMLNDMQAITIVMMTLLKNYPQIFPVFFSPIYPICFGD